MASVSEQAWKNADALFAAMRWEEARDAYKAILSSSPEHVPALLQLSYVESFRGSYREAYALTMRAAGLKPTDTGLISSLVARLRTFSEANEMNDAIGRLPSLSMISIPDLLVLGAQLSYLNEQDRALTFVEEAMRGDPKYPPTLLAYGQVLTYLGRFDEAEEQLQNCIRLAPHVAQAHWFLSRLRKQTPHDNHVSMLCARLQARQVDPEDHTLLYYALHKELDDLEDFPASWEALVRACKSKRALLRYDRSESVKLVDDLIAWGNWASSGESTSRLGFVSSEYTPIFVVGMHRSGTTLLEQMLDGSNEVRAIGELYDFTNQMRYATDCSSRGPIDPLIVERARGVDYQEVGRRYIDKMRWRLGAEKFFTDKLPSNFLNAGFICRALPEAKILHMVRSPMETCFSNLRELFSDVNAYSYDQEELADYFLQYLRLMEHWHKVFPGRILDVEYARLTADPHAVLKEVCDFCGIEFHPSMAEIVGRKRGIATASAVQVRQKVAKRDVPKWSPYARQLQPLMRYLESRGVDPV